MRHNAEARSADEACARELERAVRACAPLSRTGTSLTSFACGLTADELVGCEVRAAVHTHSAQTHEAAAARAAGDQRYWSALHRALYRRTQRNTNQTTWRD